MKKLIKNFRRSIVASKFIKKGEIFNDRNIITKRPGTGINPLKWDKVIGRRAKKNFELDEQIQL